MQTCTRLAHREIKKYVILNHRKSIKKTFMPKFKAYVKVPADSTGKLKRIVTKNIEANSSTEALALLRGQYGTKNVNIASQISEKKPRKTSHNKINSTIKKIIFWI